MSCNLEEPAIMPLVEKRPFEKRQKICIVCGKPAAGATSYLFMASGRNKIGVPFCKLHLDNHEAYASPVFENQTALALFKREHPGLYKRCVADKIILFLRPPKTKEALEH
jgi:hypothetical protein